MNKILLTIILSIVVVLAGISNLPDNARVEAKPIWVTIDVWTSKGGEGQDVAGGSYTVGEQMVLYMKSSVDCTANLSIMAAGIKGYDHVALQGNKTLTRVLGVAEQNHVGTWKIFLETTAYNQYRIDTTSFTVISPVSPPSTPPPTITIPYTPPTVTQQPSTPATPPETTSPPSVTLTPSHSTSTPPSSETIPPVQGGSLTITIDASTPSPLKALLALKIANGELAADPLLDVDNNGKVDLADAIRFLKLAVNKQ